MFHHYVSRFYLKGWQTTVGSRPQRIWVYRKNSEPRHGAIKRVAGEEDFYSVQNSDGSFDNLTVENYLGVTESKAGSVFQKFENNAQLSNQDRRIFAEFLTIFAQRNPYQKQNTEEILLSNLTENFATFRKDVEKYSPEQKAHYLKELEYLEKWHSENPAALFPKLINIDSKIVDVIESMDWAFLKSKKVKFLTCDNPFVFDTGIGDLEKGHIIFPISENMSFQATHKNNHNNAYTEIDEALANEINYRIVRFAYREVYASYNSEELKHFVDSNLGIDLQKKIEINRK